MLFLLIFVNALSKEDAEILRNVHESCIKETSVDPEIASKAIKGEYVDDEKLKEHLLCSNKKLGFIDDDGNIIEDVTVTKLVKHFPNEQLVRSAVQKCAIKQDTPVETAFQFVKCMRSLAPKDMNLDSFF
ncbi:hypothetical protein ABEB36_003273 [Hypothenemus hampei]|uniref:Uncharacterized protein n=1 Tax=Hypothenemus hampei TaxID=57062 RepID=A0ABD1FB91_HYPHA